MEYIIESLNFRVGWDFNVSIRGDESVVIINRKSIYYMVCKFFCLLRYFIVIKVLDLLCDISFLIYDK